MTTPPENILPPAGGSCEAFQWEVSQALDERRTFSIATREHLHTCAQCAAFAEAWSGDEGLHAVLAVAPAADPALAQRLVQTTLATEIPVRPARRSQASRAPWLGWAAVLALAALGWWLMDPKVAPAPTASASGRAGSAPALAMNRQMARLEQPLNRERVALQGAAAGGINHLREIFEWSSGILQ